MTPPIIDIRKLRKTYRGAAHPSVDGLTLQVSEGAFFGLLGPNGAGKTTTLSVLCGLCPYDTGEAKVGGLDVRREMGRIRRMIGVVPQEIALYPELTARENLCFFGGIQGIPSATLRERIDDYIELFDLAPHLSKKTAHLSGGMKRKVNLMVAMLHRPRVLFLDEPTVGVDVLSKQEIVTHLQALHREGMTLVYTSHDMAEAEKLCTHVALMNRGRVVCEGAPAGLLNRTGTATLEELFMARAGSEV
ncbi:ABC transporter ATP-binding protein [Tannerella forsythia]|uniref:ABC transporter ATP-binding protein n=1 Tax=Tannerella forsythia TaxID=28112 RepID=A0A3P1XYD6_TANFO|nr:ABC transporter ATP-binding protein [Tannerella forsythia]RRD62966.1 ABC transporter ATP-binding protein [Tannerella forsythia]